MDDAIPVFLCRSGIFLSKAQQQRLQEVFMTDEQKQDDPQPTDPAGATPGKAPGEGDEQVEQDVDTSGASRGGDPDSEPTGAGPSGGGPTTSTTPPPAGGTSGNEAVGDGPSGGAE
jgi:hypothetical protein